MKFFFATLWLAAAFFSSEARIFSKCELVRELYYAGIPKWDLPNWACLVQSESNFDSRVIGGPNTDGSYDYGIFQINSRYWCRIGYVGGECWLNCNSLINDDISDDIACAKIIYNVHGFWAWYGWQYKCNGQALPDISDCGI